MSENGTQTPNRDETQERDAIARAMEASKRLIDAAAKARSACLEACQESVLGIPGVQEAVAATPPVDWSMLAPQPGFPDNSPFAERWRSALGGATDPEELIAAGNRVCLECVDSYEQAVLTAIDLRERMAEATNHDWLRSLASTSFAVERDVTKAYMSSLRRLLK